MSDPPEIGQHNDQVLAEIGYDVTADGCAQVGGTVGARSSGHARQDESPRYRSLRMAGCGSDRFRSGSQRGFRRDWVIGLLVWFISERIDTRGRIRPSAAAGLRPCARQHSARRMSDEERASWRHEQSLARVGPLRQASRHGPTLIGAAGHLVPAPAPAGDGRVHRPQDDGVACVAGATSCRRRPE